MQKATLKATSPCVWLSTGPVAFLLYGWKSGFLAALESVPFMGTGVQGKGWVFVTPSIQGILQLKWGSVEWAGHRHSSVFWSLEKFLKSTGLLVAPPESQWQGRGQGALETKKLRSG